MNVKDLRDLLATLPGDLPIWVSKDPEGNGYGELYDVDRTYMSDDGYGGLEPVHRLDMPNYDHDDLTEAIVLWP
jgi:hypothetical protein